MGVRLVIMIPCLNEALDLPRTFKELPGALEGVSKIETLVVDDGSTDGTARVARELGVSHVVSHPWNLGLAKAFMTGAREAVARGADVIVNFDADGQYDARDIPTILAPILENRADIVVGERPIDAIRHFSPLKRRLQRLGSTLVRWLSGTPVRDSPSGFRALTRDAVLHLNIFNRYTYTHEMLISAGLSGLRVAGVPIRVSDRPQRPSRLVQSVFSYVWKSGLTIARMYYVYAPARFFLRFAAVAGAIALALLARFAWLHLEGRGEGAVASLVVAAIAATACGFFLVLAVVGDLIGINRRLLEDVQYMLRAARERERERDPR